MSTELDIHLHDQDLSESDHASLLLVGVSHSTAPVDVRERLAFDDDVRFQIIGELGYLAAEAVPIITCNRSEVYISGRGLPGEVDEVIQVLARYAHLSPVHLQPYIYARTGLDAAQHLFRVSAGLDSLIIGEPQILGQVREAEEEARKAHTCGPVLSRLFNSAIVAGKRARTETGISRGAGSVSQAAVELARMTVGDLSDARCLTVGLGEIGQLVARNLVAHGVKDLTLCNRSDEPARALASEIGASVVHWSDLDVALHDVDIVITATSAHEAILSVDRVSPVSQKRDGQPLLMIDIAMPRDIDPAVDTLPWIHRYDIDGLNHLREAKLAERRACIPDVEQIIGQEVERFLVWCRGRMAVPTIRELRTRMHDVREQELAHAMRKLGHLSERDQAIITAMAHRLTNKFLHEPVKRLRESEEQVTQREAVQELFGLAPESDS